MASSVPEVKIKWGLGSSNLCLNGMTCLPWGLKHWIWVVSDPSTSHPPPSTPPAKRKRVCFVSLSFNLRLSSRFSPSCAFSWIAVPAFVACASFGVFCVQYFTGDQHTAFCWSSDYRKSIRRAITRQAKGPWFESRRASWSLFAFCLTSRFSIYEISLVKDVIVTHKEQGNRNALHSTKKALVVNLLDGDA